MAIMDLLAGQKNNHINAEVDVVIISFAKNSDFKNTTLECVNSLLSSEESIHFNVFIIESSSEEYPEYADHPNIKVIHPNVSFGYHRYLNIGINLGKSEYVCLCNNDLSFKRNWATHLIKAMEKDSALLSVSPYSTIPHKTKFNLEISDRVEYGYQIRRYLAGWCIFQKRRIYEIIGPLDEDFIFWYADDDYSATLKHHNLSHALVLNSIVEHVESKTLKSEDSETRQKLTHSQLEVFEKKWKK